MWAQRLKAIANDWWLGIFLVAGILLSSWIIREAVDNVRFAMHGVEVTGRIVEVRKSMVTVRGSRKDRRQNHYETTVEYEDASGTTHRFVPDSVAGYPTLGPIGVRYDREHTDRAQVTGFSERWGVLLFALPFAVTLIAAPLFFFRHTWNSAVAAPTGPAKPPPPNALGPVRADGAQPAAASDPEAVAKSIARHRRRRG